MSALSFSFFFFLRSFFSFSCSRVGVAEPAGELPLEGRNDEA
jgi:hypothetical protein